MPLYNNITSLNTGRGNFAPSVSYYAGIKAPDKPAIHLPKANASFNIDLNSIGHAMAQMSRDQASVEETKFKLEYAQKEKAEAAAKKQLEIDTSNALAQEISNVTAQLDQGIINPLTASRMQREIKDRYRAMGILNASTIASTANAEDGGASTFLQNRREQYGKFEMDQNNKELEQIWKDVPSSRNMSNAEALNLSYNIKQAGIRAAAAIVNNNNNSGTQELSSLSNMTLARDGFDAAIYQAATTMSNAVITNPSMSPSQILQNAYENTFQFFKGNGASDEVALAAANRAMTYSKPYTDMIQNGTKEEKEYWKNRAETGKYLRDIEFHRRFPNQAFAAERPNVDFSAYVDYNPLNNRVILPAPTVATTAAYHQVGNGFVSLQTPYGVTLPDGQTLPLNEQTAEIVVNPQGYLMSIASGKMPVGSYIGRPVVAGLTATAAYNPNMNLSGAELQGKSREDINKAVANSNAFYNSVNSATGSNNITKQGEYDGINWKRVINSYDTKEGMEIWNNNSDVWNKVYEDHGRFVQDSKYLYNFLRIAPDGSLMMTPTKGLLNTVADIAEGEDFKEHIRAINNTTQGFDPKTRASLSRALVNKRGQGVLDADPTTETFITDKSTLKEVVGDKTVEGFKLISNKVVNKRIVPLEEEAVKWLEDNVATPAIKWAEEKGYSLANTYSNWLEQNSTTDNLVSRTQFAKEFMANYIRDLRNEFENKIAEKTEEMNISQAREDVDALINRVEDVVSTVEPVVEPTLSHDNRPVIFNEDGSYSTEKNIVTEIDGVSYILPTIINGEEKTEDEAVQHFLETGEHFGGYESDAKALKAEKEMHDKTEQKSFQQSSFSNQIVENYRNTPKVSQNTVEEDVKNLTNEEKTLLGEVGKALKKQFTEVENAMRAGYTGNPEDISKFVKDYNDFGERYGYVAQTLWLAKQAVPYLGGSLMQVAEGSAEKVGEWIYALLQIPGVTLDTFDKRVQKKLEKIVKENQEKYRFRYPFRSDTINMLLNVGPYSEQLEYNE